MPALRPVFLVEQKAGLLDTPNPHIAAKEPSDSGSVKELRLALVCYGGSSLAIYMHGVTKELHRLVRASSLLDTPEPAAESPSRQ